MKHYLFNTLDELLSPEALSALLGEEINTVHCKPIDDRSGHSGNQFSTITVNQSDKPRYILKRISSEWDWIMRVTDDHLGREITLWQHGIFDDLPPQAENPVIACARDGAGWAMLMHDVSEGHFVAPGAPMNKAECQAYLGGMAAIHAQFWQKPTLSNPSLGLCDPYTYLAMWTPDRLRPESGAAPIVDIIIDGWERMPLVVAPDVCDIIVPILEDPRPLADALGRYPHTLLHGDYTMDNIGFRDVGRSKIITIDWQAAAVAPPVLDISWWLAIWTGNLPCSMDEAIEIYKQALAVRLGSQFSEAWWQPQHDLSLLAGFLRVGCFFATRLLDDVPAKMKADCQAALPWWEARVRIGANLL